MQNIYKTSSINCRILKLELIIQVEINVSCLLYNIKIRIIDYIRKACYNRSDFISYVVSKNVFYMTCLINLKKLKSV